MLQRAQLMLDKQTKADLLYLSQMTNQSMSELARNYLAEKVKEEKIRLKKKSKKVNPIEAMLKMAEAAEEIERKYGSSGPTDWSINHDHYLYGAPKKKI